MSTGRVAHDPSVADYRATSPEDWGGVLIKPQGPAGHPDGESAAA
jgi:hypothetical protein